MTDMLTEQALWLSLANAFLPPTRPEVFAAFNEALGDDLAELCAELQFDTEADLAAFQQAMRGFSDHEALLVDYSSLFLQPPTPATLNLARYVDGSANGPCLDALENAYRLAGIGMRDSLHDLPDHAAMQMEVLAWLLGEEQPAISATDFAQVCLFGALPRFAATIAGTSPASPYAPLARIAVRAITRHGVAPDVAEQKRQNHAEQRADTNLGVWRHCGSCGKPFAREKEIAIMTKALAQAGLPAEHLALCPDCRDAVQGFFKRAIK